AIGLQSVADLEIGFGQMDVDTQPGVLGPCGNLCEHVRGTGIGGVWSVPQLHTVITGELLGQLFSMCQRVASRHLTHSRECDRVEVEYCMGGTDPHSSLCHKAEQVRIPVVHIRES